MFVSVTNADGAWSLVVRSSLSSTRNMPPVRFAHSAIRAHTRSLPVLNPTKMAVFARVVSFGLGAVNDPL